MVLTYLILNLGMHNNESIPVFCSFPGVTGPPGQPGRSGEALTEYAKNTSLSVTKRVKYFKQLNFLVNVHVTHDKEGFCEYVCS